jgi:hypothetical protein
MTGRANLKSKVVTCGDKIALGLLSLSGGGYATGDR